MVSGIQAVFETLASYLTGVDALWGERVRPVQTVEAGLAKPYVVFFLVDSFRVPSSPSREIHRVFVTVKGVAGGEDESDPLGTALAMQERLSYLLDNSGARDALPLLPAHDGWDIQNVTEGRVVWIPEMEADTLRVQHAGHQYEFLLERK